MPGASRSIGCLALASGIAALAGCSVDAVIWGADGAIVIETTDQLIAGITSGDGDDYVCSELTLDLGTPEDWHGLSPGEPERFVAEYWPDQAELDPAWSINLELPPGRVAAGHEYPGDVFYRETEDGLCLVDVAWWTVEG